MFLNKSDHQFMTDYLGDTAGQGQGQGQRVVVDQRLVQRHTSHWILHPIGLYTSQELTILGIISSLPCLFSFPKKETTKMEGEKGPAYQIDIRDINRQKSGHKETESAENPCTAPQQGFTSEVRGERSQDISPQIRGGKEKEQLLDEEEEPDIRKERRNLGWSGTERELRMQTEPEHSSVVYSYRRGAQRKRGSGSQSEEGEQIHLGWSRGVGRGAVGAGRAAVGSP